MTAVPLRLAAFVAVLGMAFAASYAVGTAAGPVAGTNPADSDDSHAADSDDAHADTAAHRADDAEAVAALPGLAVTDSGYTLTPDRTTLPAGPRVPFPFRVVGPDGAAVMDFTEAHEKRLHLIVVRRDLSGFQHVHPTQGADGTWTVDLDLHRGGTYRAYADIEPTALGRNIVLGTDLSVPGDFAPADLPAPTASTVVDGYRVTLSGVPSPGREAELTFAVSRAGRPVDSLQPYLGAFGHLVTLRAGDLAYLHTHPAEEAHDGGSGGPTVRFGTTFPSAGTYRLYLDFQVDGKVRTAELTVDVETRR